MKISVIIPIYNEEKTVEDCLRSITNQTLKPHEVIVVDDGSEDNSKFKIKNAKLQFKIENLRFLEQKHKGPGIARNLGVKHAKGDILVFVDADMTFDRKFLEKLTEPIRRKKAKGTFTKNEYVDNWENVWAWCWNINQNLPEKRRIPKDYPDTAPVFRAILKSEFEKVQGFDNTGYADDWTLAQKLGYEARAASGAISYHKNPESLTEIFVQARWIGKNEFLTRTILRRLVNLIRFSLPVSIIIGIWKSVKNDTFRFILFKLTYDFGVFVSIIGSFFGEQKTK